LRLPRVALMPVDGIGKRTGPSPTSRPHRANRIVRIDSGGTTVVIGVRAIFYPILFERNSSHWRGALVNPGGTASTLGKPVLMGKCGFLANLQVQQCSRGTGDLTLSVGNALDGQEGRNPCCCCGLECLSRRSFANSIRSFANNFRSYKRFHAAITTRQH
jgi:hypothetical protein